jgi:hypothetical protein
VDGTWGWFATPVSKHVIVCWVFRDLLCTTRPGFDELHVLPNSRGPHQIDWYKKRPRFTKPMLLAPRLQVGTWIKNDLGYACYLEQGKLTCKNSHGYGFYISTVDGRAYYFDPPQGTHLNKDFAYFGEGVRVDVPLNAFAGGGDEGAGSYRYFCRLVSNDTLLCWRSSPWLSIILQSKGRPVLRESELGDSSGKMFVPLLDASKWWRHEDNFACAMRGDTFETSDLICENSMRHGFRLSQTQVELF